MREKELDQAIRKIYILLLTTDISILIVHFQLLKQILKGYTFSDKKFNKDIEYADLLLLLIIVCNFLMKIIHIL